MGMCIVVTSGKGGVGKTATVANLGIRLAQAGKRVVLVDMDLGLRNLDVFLGLEDQIVYDLVDIADGQCRLQQALVRDRRHDYLYLLPATQVRESSAVSVQQMRNLCELLKAQFDIVLLDSPSGIGQGFRNAIAGADRAIVITTPELTAIRDADRVIGLLETEGKRDIQVLINRIRPSMVRQGAMMTVAEVSESLAVPLLGVIPEDEAVIFSCNQGCPVELPAVAAIAFNNIVNRLLGEEVPLMNSFMRPPGFIARLRQLF